jgi:hypothetical protein
MQVSRFQGGVGHLSAFANNFRAWRSGVQMLETSREFAVQQIPCPASGGGA